MIPLNTLIRDTNGYGTLPAFAMFCLPAEGFAPGAIVNGSEVAVIHMEDDAAQLDVDDVAHWNPTCPDGDGWQLAVIADGDAGPWALWVRPQLSEGRAYAEEFLLGSLIKAATRNRMRAWSER